MQFYPDPPTVTIDPLQGNGELRYVLVFPPHFFSGRTSREDLTLKYAFRADWKVESELKAKIRTILVNILDIENFRIEMFSEKFHIMVPVKSISDSSLLPQQGILEIPLVVKIDKKLPDSDKLDMKCGQTIRLVTECESAPAVPEEYLELPEEERDREPSPCWSDASEELATAVENTVKPSSAAPQLRIPKNLPAQTSRVLKESAEPTKKRSYAGVMAIDFGTTNSVVVVRDPHFGAEEIQFDLSQDQWNSLCKWMDSWLIHHLSAITPSQADLAVDELVRIVPGFEISPLGSLSMDLWTDLQKANLSCKAQLLSEVLAFLSACAPEEMDSTWRQLAFEVLGNFEKIVYSKTLESQRYFVLELDRNAGPGPISSALQIVSSPSSSDPEKLETETEVEMGVRVNLLMRSAAVREADIRQFALTIKRYFGQGDSIELVPAETASMPVRFSDATLCRLAYNKLIQRALEDLRIRSRSGEFEDADRVDSIVATFPTTYPASLRRKLRDILGGLEISEIDTRFDEGTASAIYYIWREICADPICGMDGIMARCRQDRYGRAYQNILLYDFGGGTTDVALIQLIYQEMPIFEPIDKEKFRNGRYFRIMPRLLGSTGHRYIGGDLITLWLFRLVKTKLADRLLTLAVTRDLGSSEGSDFARAWAEMPEELLDSSGQYRPGILLDWAYYPMQNFRQYQELNKRVIDRIVPTAFAENPSCTSNFFTLWDLTEEAKKILGMPIANYEGSGLGKEWPDKVALDANQLWKLMTTVHPWLAKSVRARDFALELTQEELYAFAESPVIESLSLALNMAKARLRSRDVHDKLDRFILSGLSCNLQVVQEEARKIFQGTEKLFEFSRATVFFEQEVAKTSVAMGACIGRYLEGMRIDPYDEKTRQALRDGYEQVELVVENLFNYLTCRLVYGSLVATVTMFDYGLPFNQKSYWDKKPVTRTPMDALRPVQEKFWVYRIDFDGASPQYLGLVNAEDACYKNGFDDFRRFREQYVVGFEADTELFIRAFFLPKGPKNLLAVHFLDDEHRVRPMSERIRFTEDGPTLVQTVTSQELFNRKPVLAAGATMRNTIEYPDGSRFRCAMSEILPKREIYDFYIEDCREDMESPLAAHFLIKQEDVDEMALVCDETGRLVLLLSIVYDIKIWAEMYYLPQKVDPQYDPFCGLH